MSSNDQTIKEFWRNAIDRRNLFFFGIDQKDPATFPNIESELNHGLINSHAAESEDTMERDAMPART